LRFLPGGQLSAAGCSWPAAAAVISADLGHMTLTGPRMAGTCERFLLAQRYRERAVRLCVKTGPEQAAGTTEAQMTQYLISFGAHAMDHIPDDDAPAVARAAHAVVQEAVDAGVYVSAGGLAHQPASIVTAGGSVTGGPYPEAIGGFTLIDVPSREEALAWAAKIAAACRCAQEVREIGTDPELDAMLRHADSRR